MDTTESSGPERMAMHTNSLRIIYAMSFIDLFAVGAFFPFLGPYVISLGCTQTQVGVFTSIYAALQVISGPIIGSWSDVRGRKPIFLVTLAISTVVYFLMGFCTTVNCLIFYRFLLGIFKHSQTLLKAIIADLTGKDKRLNTAVYGRCTSFGAMGFVVGPMIGGHLSEYDNGFQYICTLTSVLFVINTSLVYFLPNLEPPRPARNRDVTQSVMSEIKIVMCDLKDVDWRQYWGPFLLKFLYIFVTTMFFANQPFHLKNIFDAGKVEVGYVISFVSFVGMLCGFNMVPITRYVYKLDETAPLRTLHMFLLLTICFLGLFSASNIYAFVLLLFPFGVCNAVLRIVTMELVFDKCRDYERGSLTGASDSMMALGRLMAPMTAGFLADNSLAGGVMMYAALFSFLGAVIAYHMYVVDKLESEQTTREKTD